MGTLEHCLPKRNFIFFYQVSGRSAARNHPNPGSRSDSGLLSWTEGHLAGVYTGSGLCTFTSPQQGLGGALLDLLSAETQAVDTLHP